MIKFLKIFQLIGNLLGVRQINWEISSNFVTFLENLNMIFIADICIYICIYWFFQQFPNEIFNFGSLWYRAVLSFEELTTVKRNLQTDGNVEVDYELIRETWHPVYRRHFLRKALRRCHDCRRGFFMYSKGIESDVSFRILTRLTWLIHTSFLPSKWNLYSKI